MANMTCRYTHAADCTCRCVVQSDKTGSIYSNCPVATFAEVSIYGYMFPATDVCRASVPALVAITPMSAGSHPLPSSAAAALVRDGDL